MFVQATLALAASRAPRSTLRRPRVRKRAFRRGNDGRDGVVNHHPRALRAASTPAPIARCRPETSAAGAAQNGRDRAERTVIAASGGARRSRAVQNISARARDSSAHARDGCGAESAARIRAGLAQGEGGDARRRGRTRREFNPPQR